MISDSDLSTLNKIIGDRNHSRYTPGGHVEVWTIALVIKDAKLSTRDIKITITMLAGKYRISEFDIALILNAFDLYGTSIFAYVKNYLDIKHRR